ncbi:ROK family transcriptional regulator [Kitasatospora sp. MMS16-BH015]|uniref:ROK family protein n=1 Tax=Kitasatospora sp. MMS16-BH015 TaxID=2018025 RepID=UPI000CA3DA65|nr:ROK family protein [Kitasatospora sp. MMS16-BH015]AUG82147.1 ROK family transcriptional regulator [Kitasatospora sp. MMS16-BH015]
MATGTIAAVDIGGTKIAVGLVASDGALLATARRPTPAESDGETVLKALLSGLDELAAHPAWAGVTAVGIGSAGPVDTAAGTVSPVNIPGWRGFPVAARVAEHLGHRLPVVLTGDGIAIAAAEHRFGAARPYDNALCMVVSTGVGGGLILNGALHSGRTGNAGHIGHISVDLDGETCPCGSRGCLERLASGPAIARHAAALGWHPLGPDTSAAAVATAAAAGDPAALAAYDRAGRALAAGIAATATLVELDAVVIGGGVAQAGDLLLSPLRSHLATYAALPFTTHLTVHQANLGPEAGLIGAAAAAMG